MQNEREKIDLSLTQRKKNVLNYNLFRYCIKDLLSPFIVRCASYNAKRKLDFSH